jgi:hypothetical protein
MAVRTVRSTGSPQDFRQIVIMLNQLAALANELRTDHNALLAQMDTDAGITGTNFAANFTVAAVASDTLQSEF